MRPGIFILLLTLAFTLMGCSSGDKSPLLPEGNNSSNSLDSIPIIGASSYGDSVYQATGLLGAYELIINPDELTAELVNKRTSAIGESYVVSGIGFFTIAPCANCLNITGVALDLDGNAILSFEIKHPFPPGNTSEPPSAANRLDLDVFDVAMVIVPSGATPATYILTGDSVYTGYSISPDGYTAELANVITDNAAMPYFLVVDDSEGTASTFNKFAMGDSASFDVGFDLSAGLLNFDMYLTMGYGFSAKKPNRLEPKYYNPEFNRKAAWKVVVTPPEGVDMPDMTNTWNDMADSDLWPVTVMVYDWQQTATVYSGLPEDFGDADADNVFASSEVASVSVEVPGMNATLPSVTTEDSGTGTPIDPLVYTVSFANENLIAAGEYVGLVKVTDERAVLTPTDGRDFLIDTPNGILLENYEMPGYSTYQTFIATVVSGITPIVELTSPNGGETWGIGWRKNITWTTTDYTGQIKLEYSKDGFVADTIEIITSTDDDGVYEWVVPNDASTTVRVRVTLADLPSIYDDSDADFSILNEAIVYSSNGQVYSIDPDGLTTPELWTSLGVADVACPKLSPCGGYILYGFLNFSDFRAYLHIIDVATSVDTDLTPSGLQSLHGDFSHDGTRIVASVASSWIGPMSLWLMDYDGGNTEVLASAVGFMATECEYSWDDSSIYYICDSPPGEVFVCDVDTGLSTQFTATTSPNSWHSFPHGNPECTQITWATDHPTSRRRIYISPVNSWLPTDKVIDIMDYNRAPCFNPDGTKLVFDCNNSGFDSEIVVYNLSDETWINITDNTTDEYEPDWGLMIPH